jgi:hypothetical protein
MAIPSITNMAEAIALIVISFSNPSPHAGLDADIRIPSRRLHPVSHLTGA